MEEGGGGWGHLMDPSRAQALTKLIYKLTVQTEWLKIYESVKCWKLLKYCTIEKCARSSWTNNNNRLTKGNRSKHNNTL